jgi:hypothetical protein
VQVFQHQQQRLPGRRTLQQVGGSLQQLPALFVAVVNLRRRELEPLAERWNDSGQFGGGGGAQLGQHGAGVDSRPPRRCRGRERVRSLAMLTLTPTSRR